MAVLTATNLVRTGINPFPTTAADVAGDEVANPRGDIAFYVKNGGASPVTLTLDIRASGPDGAVVTDPTVTVANGTTKMVGPFPTGIYNDANGHVHIAYSDVTSVTVLAVRLNP
jgi:hypothetical protein